MTHPWKILIYLLRSRVQVLVLNRNHGCKFCLNCTFTIISLDWLKPCVNSTIPCKLYCNNKHPQISVASTTGLFLAHLHMGSAGNCAVSTLWNVATAERGTWELQAVFLQLPFRCDDVISALSHWSKQVTWPYATSRGCENLPHA